MNPKEKQALADQLLSQYLAMGFGNLPKREIDLLVFHHLMQSTGYRGKSNYELANALGISEARIKSLKLNAALRFKDINPQAVLGRVVERLVASRQFASLSEDRIEISLEDPIEKREMEHFLKQKGHHAEYTLNSEVLRITPARLLELILSHAEGGHEAFADLVRAHIADEAASARILAQAPSLRQKLDKLRAEHLGPETLKSLIEAAVKLLSGAG